MTRPRAPETTKHDAILEAALALFGEQGFHGTTVPEVAARAKVAAGTLYRYYPSKDALVNVLYRHWKQALSDALFDDLPRELPLRERFHRVWQRLVAFAHEHREAVLFLEFHHHGSYLDAESRRREQAVHRRAVALFKSSEGEGVLKPVPAETLVSIVWGTFVGVLKAGWAGSITLDQRTIDAAERCAWDAITE